MRARHALAVAIVIGFPIVGVPAPPDQIAFFSRPDIHGDMVVFTAEGDLWLGSISSGEARRITSDPGLETFAHFSPDGTMLAFTAQYDRNNDVYVMPIGGGSPKRLTYDPATATVLGWTPDGKNVIFRTFRGNFNTDQHRLFTVSVNGGLPKQMPVPTGEFAAVRPDGKEMAYVPGSAEWMNWFRYQGGEADDIWLTDLTGRNFKKLTDNPGIDTTPCWLGDKIAFAQAKGSGLASLCLLDPETQSVTQLSHFDDQPVRYPASDGKRVVFQKGATIWLYDPTGGVRELHFVLNSDRIHMRPHSVAVATTFREAALGPTGKRLILESQGQLVSVAAENGDSRTLEGDSSGRAMHPAWSPDGKHVAYISDKGGEEQIYLIDSLGGTPKKLTKDLHGEHFDPVWAADGKHLAIGDREMRIQLVDATTGEVKPVDQSDRAGSYDTVNSDYTFSPDGKWLAFSRNEWTWNKGIHLYELATGKSYEVTNPAVNSFAPSFDPTGKYLYFLQDREITPIQSPLTNMVMLDDSARVTCLPLAKDTPSPFAPKNEEEGVKAEEPKTDKEDAATKPDALPTVKIDPADFGLRMVDVPVDAGRYTEVDPIPGKLVLLNPTGSAALEDAGAGGAVAVFDLDTKKSVTLADSGVTGIQLSNDDTKLLIAKGKALQVVDPNSAADVGTTGAVNLAGVDVEVVPVAEWHEAFEEAWRIGRDFFYDPNMHGVNWMAVRKKYEAMLPLVADRSDLTRIIGDMIAELNVGHAYVSGATGYTVPRQPMGFLGVDLEPDPSGHAYKITKILHGDAYDLANRSPLLLPGLNVHEGDYILEIAGKRVSTDLDPQALLINTQGHTITLKVNSKPSEDGARIIRVVAAVSETEMRYEDWVEGRREYVAKATNGQVGYVHMSDMDAAGFRGFVKGYYPSLEKPGIVFDDRFNGGGFVSANVLLQLASKPLGYFKPRYGISWAREGWAPLGYVVGLTNEWAFSDGELFAEYFKRMRVGPMVGTRTGGGEVGSGNGYELVDGGEVWIPNYGAWVPGEGWIIEGSGVTPDVTVHQDPALLMQGKDPQLDKAIELELQHIREHPFTRPTPPPFPVKVKSGG